MSESTNSIMKWIDLEEDLCGRVQRAREIMRMLAKHNVATDSDTVAGLRIVAEILQDNILGMANDAI